MTYEYKAVGSVGHVPENAPDRPHITLGIIPNDRVVNNIHATISERYTYTVLCRSLDSFESGIRPIRNESDYIATITIIPFSLIGQSEIRMFS